MQLDVKCDERRPNCRKCCSFGISCNFMLNVPDLQPIVMDTNTPMTRKETSPQPAISSSIWTYDRFTCYELNTRCQDFLSRYLERSLVTPYDPNMVHVNRRLLRLAFSVSVDRTHYCHPHNLDESNHVKN